MDRVQLGRGVLAAVWWATIGCASRSEAIDPLEEMLRAQCLHEARCACGDVDSSECDAYARTRAVELRDQGRRRGARLLDADCAELARRAAQTVCVDGGIPYEVEDAELAAEVQRCRMTLLHGERRIDEPCEHPWELPYPRYSDCEAGAACMDPGDGARCLPLPIVHRDVRCFDIDAEFGCPTDKACVPVDEDTSECQPLTIVGQPCVGSEGDYCEGPPGQWCDLSTRTCRALPGPGEPCHEPDPLVRIRCADGISCDARCTYDAYCEGGRCEPRHAAGEACSGFSGCALGLECREGVCAGEEACWYP